MLCHRNIIPFLAVRIARRDVWCNLLCECNPAVDMGGEGTLMCFVRVHSQHQCH